MSQQLGIHCGFGYRSVQLIKSEANYLGNGFYGTVYKAKCDLLPCAAKILHPSLFATRDPAARRIVQHFEHECEFLRTMRTIRHTNIVQFLGTSRDPESRLPVLLMELMDESLTSFLERPQDPPPLPFHVQVNIAHDVAQALAYLHLNEILHRDLSSNNVLLVGSSQAKVTDFDMSKLLGNDPRLTPTLSPGTMVYMSPEALGEPPAYTRKLDIFSNGVLLVQVITRKFPDPGPRMKTVQVGEYSHFEDSEIHVKMSEVVRHRSHIDLVDPAHPLLNVALDCLKDKEGQRPTAEQLCSRLAALKESPRYRDSLQPAQQAAENLGVAAEAQAEPQRELLQQNQELRQQLEEGREALQAKEREVDSLTRNMEQLQLLSHTQERKDQDREAEFRRKNEQIHQMGEQLRQTSEQLQERKVQIQRKEVQIQQMGEENEELRQQLEEGRETLQAKEREVDSLTRNMEQLQLQSHTQERQDQDREAEIRRKNEQLQERNVQIQRLEAQIQQLHQTSQDSEQLIATLQQSIEQKEKKTETCSVTLPETCSVGESAQVSVKVPQSVGTNVQAQLKSLADPSCAMLQASVAPTNADTYTITFTPRVRGRHDLTVTVNGEEIAGSPFRVFVKIHPTQLGQPVRTITGLNQPWGIAINSKQQLMVAEGGGKKITIMERDGKRVQTIECDEFKYPRGVATGPDGAIYVADCDAQCLFKFDKEGKLLKTVQNNLKSPYSVKIIRNQLYVADDNLVKIFDTDCNVVGTIQTNECPNPYNIAVGEDGLYVVGSGGKIAVYRCAPNGEFIRHLNINPSLNLSHIHSICFDSSGHLIVSSYGGSTGVYIFQPSGERVASLSLASSGGIQCPAGIAIDDDGFVYVCDFSIGTVTVF